MRSVELFAGAGGLAIAGSLAGFRHESVVEFDGDACETIRENQRRNVNPVVEWPLFEGDVRKFDYGTVKPGIDLVSGGPPCQPFSLGGKHLGHEDDRNMFPEAVRAVRELKPRAFLFENVKGLLRESFAKYFNYIVLQLTYPEITRGGNEQWQEHLSRLEKYHTRGEYSGLYYRVVPGLMNAADYGVPQKRERVFLVGFRSDIKRKWSFPLQTHSQESLLWSQWVTEDYWDRHHVARRNRPDPQPRFKARIECLRSQKLSPSKQAWQTVRDAISDLPKPRKKERSDVLNHRLVLGARPYPGHTGSLLDEPAKTLKAGDHGVPGGENTVLYPNGTLRYFTVRESARLQGFPDTYFFPGSWTVSMRQLGNAVPVTLAHVVAKSVKDCLEHCVNCEGTAADKGD